MNEGTKTETISKDSAAPVCLASCCDAHPAPAQKRTAEGAPGRASNGGGGVATIAEWSRDFHVNRTAPRT
jgi:hypothetical protein